MRLLHIDSRTDYGSRLHLGNFRISHCQTASAVPHHGIELVEGIADFLHFLGRHHHLHRQIVDIALLRGYKLMQRRIKEANGDRSAFHHFI